MASRSPSTRSASTAAMRARKSRSSSSSVSRSRTRRLCCGYSAAEHAEHGDGRAPADHGLAVACAASSAIVDAALVAQLGHARQAHRLDDVEVRRPRHRRHQRVEGARRARLGQRHRALRLDEVAGVARAASARTASAARSSLRKRAERLAPDAAAPWDAPRSPTAAAIASRAASVLMAPSASARLAAHDPGGVVAHRLGQRLGRRRIARLAQRPRRAHAIDGALGRRASCAVHSSSAFFSSSVFKTLLPGSRITCDGLPGSGTTNVSAAADTVSFTSVRRAVDDEAHRQRQVEQRRVAFDLLRLLTASFASLASSSHAYSTLSSGWPALNTHCSKKRSGFQPVASSTARARSRVSTDPPACFCT